MSPRELIRVAFADGWEADTGVAYHGTSLAVLEEVIKTGRINGSTYIQVEKSIDLCVRAGDIFVVPILNRVQPGLTRSPYLSEKEAFEKAAGYASDISYHHYFMKLCGYPLMTVDSLIKGEWINLNFVDFSDSFIPSLPRSEQDDELVIPFYDFLACKGYDPAGIARLHQEAISKKGVVFSFDAAIFSDVHQPLPGNSGYDTRVLDVNIEHLAGIQPLDQESYDFLEGL